MLMSCVIQLRRMQEMIAKMQAQMQKQGDGEGDGPHVWEAYGRNTTRQHTPHSISFWIFWTMGHLISCGCNVNIQMRPVQVKNGHIWMMMCNFSFSFPLQVFEPLLNYDQRELDESIKGVKAVWLLTHTACHYLHSVPHVGSGVFFCFIHTVKYIQTVLCLYIYTRFHFFLFFKLFFHFVKLLLVTQIKSCDPSLQMVVYIFNTNTLGYSVTSPIYLLPYFCAIEKTKVLVLLFSAFSPRTSLKAHANISSVRELHWESAL